jgi:hypothetical protein
MIKGLTSGTGINVQGGLTSFPYVPMNSNNPISGMLRVNGQDMQVFDGSSWITLGASYATVELNGETQAILQWAREQRDKQQKREQRIQSNPALKNAYEAIRRAEENYDILDKIVGDDI